MLIDCLNLCFNCYKAVKLFVMLNYEFIVTLLLDLLY